ncbi:interleukin-8-like isoform X1 [Rana temporaria]|uniref:interleukin-8-like isoform X1 n=1 Tax=Rana temporaria TaxID=8407 RepID=UPI001AACEAF7|nr:interleukin-8-like isoform X1 [Rana temporaria]
MEGPAMLYLSWPLVPYRVTCTFTYISLFCLSLPFLFTASAKQTEETTGLSSNTGFSVAADMRCQCVKTLSKPIQIQQVLKLELINSGPYCPKVEVIVTLKRGSIVCLTPEAKWVKRLISKILKRAKKT